MAAGMTMASELSMKGNSDLDVSPSIPVVSVL